MERFNPKDETEEQEGEGMVMCMVKFTKFLFAQLNFQRFTPPKCFFVPSIVDPNFRVYDLGAKVACGFEVLYQSTKEYEEDSLDVESYKFSADGEWKKYLKKLQRLGFFGDEISGSREHQRKLLVAKEKFIEMKKEDIKNEKNFDVEFSAATRMDTLIKKNKDTFTTKQFRRELERDLRADDEETWMEVTPSEVDDILAAKQKEFEEYDRNFNKQDIDEDDQPPCDLPPDFENLIGGMKSFIEKNSSYKGAEFPESEEKADLFLDVLKSIFPGVGSNTNGRDDYDEPPEFFDLLADESMEQELNEQEMEEMMDLMSRMDIELNKTKLGEDFEKFPEEDGQNEEQGQGGEVDMDYNLLKNLLGSIENQQGGHGPASNILRQLSTHPPS
eukprot:CAMPEP_0174279576 /NCGR_PEP_ID=MMETSP0439-20130205/62112_1 /TAXON_ID=0 /ORGANISM="Stereomyxa ramosa, Strain Chinc5" /LENGTH=386 /DNA_ID=CAMNT_0015372119 /DNA_START=794 /DNA_END=1954 /DNA_ORIENTATION=+